MAYIDTEHYHSKLINIVTEYDRRQSTKKYYNHYALAQYCQAVSNTMEELSHGRSIEDALKACFCGALLRHIVRKLGLTIELSKRD